MNVKNNLDMTIIVVSCDQYSDMWQSFFELKENNWPDCPYRTILVNNIMPFSFPNTETLNCGIDAQWSTRTRKVLELIDTKYVCFLLEDFYITSKVSNVEVQGALDMMREHAYVYYRLLQFSKTGRLNQKHHYDEIRANQKYALSLQAAIWDREFFLKKLGEGDYNPWLFEIERNRESASRDCSKDVIGVYDRRNILNITHMVVQGKFLPNALKDLRKSNIIVDTSVRGVMPYHQYISYRVKRIFVPLIINHPFLSNISRRLGLNKIERKYSQ